MCIIHIWKDNKHLNCMFWMIFLLNKQLHFVWNGNKLHVCVFWHNSTPILSYSICIVGLKKTTTNTQKEETSCTTCTLLFVTMPVIMRHQQWPSDQLSNFNIYLHQHLYSHVLVLIWGLVLATVVSNTVHACLRKGLFPRLNHTVPESTWNVHLSMACLCSHSSDELDFGVSHAQIWAWAPRVKTTSQKN